MNKKVIKRLSIVLLTFILSLTNLITYANAYSDKASSDGWLTYYPMQCGGSTSFEVDWINDTAGFDLRGCYATFGEAKTAMNTVGDDAVIRHPGSYSMTHIIAMKYGVAYTYPGREGSLLMKVNGYQNSAQTYTSKYRQLDYWDTLSFDANTGRGNIYVTLAGFDAVAELFNVDLIPQKFIDKHFPIWLGGYDASDEHEAPYYTQIQRTYYAVEQRGNYKDLVLYAFSGWGKNGGTPINIAAISVCPAADWMNVGDYYYTYDDINYFRDPYFRDKAGTYVNYYQFVPMRSKSYIPSEAYNGFLAAKGYTNSVMWNTGQYFIAGQQNYGVNAMLVFAQACNESAYGTSYFARNRYNLFGWNAVDSNPNEASRYSDLQYAIGMQMGVQLQYGYMTSKNRYTFYGDHLGNKGSGITVKYASAPYYGLQLAAVAYEFDKFSKNYNGELTDYNTTQIGLVTESGVNVRSAPNGNVLYQTGYATGYQKTYTVAVLGQSGDWYQIQSLDRVVNGHNGVDMSDRTAKIYNWEQSVGYISAQYVQLLNTKVTPIIPLSTAGEWRKDGVGWWYRFYDGTYPKSQWLQIPSNSENAWYHFNEQGYMDTGWLNDGGYRYHLGTADDGKMKVGWQTIEDDWYFFNTSGQLLTGWLHVGGQWYYSDATTGKMQTGWLMDGGNKYYLNPNGGNMLTGWQTVENGLYYLNNSGQIQTGWFQIGGLWYYGDTSTGQVQTGWLTEGGHKYYLNIDDGKMLVGWNQIDDEWYYFNLSGHLQTGWIHANGVWYYSAPDTGIMQIGFVDIDGNRYYLNPPGGNMITGWGQISGDWYIFNTSGHQLSGWVYTYGLWYYMDPTNQNKMATGWITDTSGNQYFINADGTWRG